MLIVIPILAQISILELKMLLTPLLKNADTKLDSNININTNNNGDINIH